MGRTTSAKGTERTNAAASSGGAPLVHSAMTGSEKEAHAYAVYQIQEDADDWERKLTAHPSLLDAALQSSSIIGMAQHL